MALSPQIEVKLKKLVCGTPQATIEAMIQALEDEGLPVSWKEIVRILRDTLGCDLSKSYVRHFDKLMVPAGDRLHYVRKVRVEAISRRPDAESKEDSPGVCWSPPKVGENPHQESWYSQDLGLRQIAKNQVKCFGHYSWTDRSCSGCTFARFCAEARDARVEELARTLDQAFSST